MRPLTRVRALLTAFAAALLVAPAAQANVPFREIRSPGPLQRIVIGNDLSCQVQIKGDDIFSFAPARTAPGDCGVFVSRTSDKVLFSPNWPQHTLSYARFRADEGNYFAPVSQSAVSGSGTPASPFTLVTKADVPGTLHVTRTDSYVTGASTWRIAITLEDAGAGMQEVIIYHAGDCFLNLDDAGFGAVDRATGAAYCTSTADNVPPGRQIGFGPVSAADRVGSSFIEGRFDSDVWNATDGDAPYPGICRCTSLVDNGVGVSWVRTVPAGGSVTVRMSSTVKQPPPRCRGRRPTIVGTDRRDVLAGTRRADVIVGLGGSDVIRGKGRRDIVCGGPGRDRLLGGGGGDILLGQRGNDTARGGRGKDKLVGGAGRDRLRGGPGNDELLGGAARDRLSGGRGLDRCFGGRGRDRAGGCERTRKI